MSGEVGASSWEAGGEAGGAGLLWLQPPPPARLPNPTLTTSLPHSEHDLGEDIYDCVPCEDEGDDIYEDIIKVEVQQPMVSRPPRPARAPSECPGRTPSCCPRVPSAAGPSSP